jgi:2,3-bisphosphoglycerate-independent phosphoglycerate mutase
MSIADSSFLDNEILNNACQHALKNKSSLHLMGLLGGGVTHASSEHIYSLIHLARLRGVKDVFIHVFTDGRDSPPNSSLTYITELEGELAKEGVGKIATVMGRYYAMDRDRRWERTEKAYLCLTKGGERDRSR